MHILITGGAGFIGSHLAERCLADGHTVTSLDLAPDHKVRHLLDRPGFKSIKGSVLDADLVDTCVRRADCVFHLAAVVGVEHYVTDPLHVLDVNINGTWTVLKAALRHERKVVYASTSEVYGKLATVPFREDGDRLLGSTRIDRWSYSTSKATGEHLCFAYAKHGLPVVVVRFFNVYGPRLDAVGSGRVMTIFLGQLLRGEDLTVIGDGRQTRCFTYVEDAIEATYQAGRRPEALGGIFNIGDDREVTILEIAERMVGLHPHGSAIRFVRQEQVYGSRYEDIPRRVPDNARMRTILGVTPRTSLDDGLRRTVEWFVREGDPRGAPASTAGGR